MKEQILSIMGETLTQLLAFVKDAALIVSAEVPKYILELLKIHVIYYGADAIIYFFWGLLILAVCIYATHFFIKLLKTDWDMDEEIMFKSIWTLFFIMVVWGLFFCVGAMNLLNISKANILQIVKIKEAPRVYIMEYLQKQIKGLK